MGSQRRRHSIGLGLGLLFGIGSAATPATNLPARLQPAGTIDTSFSDSTQQPGRVLTDFRDGSLEQANAVVIQPDGKIVAAGWSTAPGGDHNFALVRYNVDGTIDTSFGDGTSEPGRVLTDFRALPDGTRSNDEIRALVIQPDGKIVAGGVSNSPNGDDNFALVRYNPNGTIDTTFGDNTQQPGRVLTDFRALADGTRSQDVINALALQPDGKIVAGGRSNSPNGDDNFALVRYNPDGTIDTSFGDNTQQPGRVLTDFGGHADEIRALALQPNGEIVAAGRSGASGSAGQAAVAAQRQGIIQQFQALASDFQFAPDPQDPPPLDSQFGGLDYWDWEMEKGNSGSKGGQWQHIWVLLYENSYWAETGIEGDAAKGISGNDAFSAARDVGMPATVGAHDAILVVGHGMFPDSNSVRPDRDVYLLWRCENLVLVCEASDHRTDTNTQADLTQLQQQLVGVVQGLADTVDQRFTQAQLCQPTQAEGDQFALVRYNANGTPDPSFGGGRVLTDFGALPGGSRSTGLINALALQADGKILAGGKANAPNGDDNFALVRYNADGTIDASFGDSTQQPGRVLIDFRQLPDDSRSTDAIRALAIQPEGRIIAAGYSNSPNGDSNFALVRYNPDGTIDTGFGDSTQQPGRVLTDFRALADGTRSSDAINAIALQPDAKIVAVGYSDSPNGEDNFALVRYYGTPTIGPPPGTGPQNPPQPAQQINVIVTLSAVEANGGAAVTGTVHLSQPAPAGGLSLVLQSDTPHIASVPPTLIIPAGASSGTFPITTLPVSGVTDVGILVDFADPLSPRAGNPDDVDLSLRPGAAPGTPPGTTPGTTPGGTTPGTTPPPAATGKIDLSLSLGANTVKGGTMAAGTVTLSQPAPAGGLILTFSTNAPNVAAVPGSLRIPAGANSSPFPIFTFPVTAVTPVEISVGFADPQTPLAGNTGVITMTVIP